MAWERASADGGPLEPHAWVTLHEPSRYAALDSRISRSLRERAEQDRLRARLASTQSQISRLTDAVAAHHASPIRELAETAVDLTAAGVRRVLGGGEAPPATPRIERRRERARLGRELAAARKRLESVREDLQRTGHVYRDLMSAVTEKAGRVIADEAEGWREVREVLHEELPRAKDGFEQVEMARDRLREARLTAQGMQDAVRLWHVSQDHGAGADAARVQARRLGEAVDALRADLTRLGPDAPGLGALPDVDIPPHGTAPELHRSSEEMLKVVGRICRGLDALGRLDEVAAARIRDIAEAEEALVTLMRRPY